jgi:hypothetical protein
MTFQTYGELTSQKTQPTDKQQFQGVMGKKGNKRVGNEKVVRMMKNPSHFLLEGCPTPWMRRILYMRDSCCE